MTKEKFVEILEKESGLKIGTDFGFILGTQHSFEDNQSEFSISGLINGYKVWRKQGRIVLESTFISKGEEEDLKILLSFLKREMPISPKLNKTE